MKGPMTVSILLWAAAICLIALLFTNCTKFGDTAVYVVQANDLAEDALALERIVLAADVPDDQRPGLQQAVRDLKLIATEARRFESVEDATKLDLTRMHRAYLRTKSDMLYIRSIIYDEPGLTVWLSIPEHDRLQLTLFWSDAAVLAEDIDMFIADPDTGNYLQVAARITAYGTIAAKVLMKITPLIIADL